MDVGVDVIVDVIVDVRVDKEEVDEFITTLTPHGMASPEGIWFDKVYVVVGVQVVGTKLINDVNEK